VAVLPRWALSRAPESLAPLAIGDEVFIEAVGAYTAAYTSVGFNDYPPLKQYVI